MPFYLFAAVVQVATRTERADGSCSVVFVHAEFDRALRVYFPGVAQHVRTV